MATGEAAQELPGECFAKIKVSHSKNSKERTEYNKKFAGLSHYHDAA